MNRVEQALATFRQKPCMYNCAQTVCAAFGREDLVESMASCGGGRAPEGTCGALYGAMQVMPEKSAAILAAFTAANGASTCREIKGCNRVPCQECVRRAATILVELGM
ncbi:MAG: hypothetical protein IJO38_08100 [Akkermansia sp.]|nr:hypothetical protein [Akkermansia sp.]